MQPTRRKVLQAGLLAGGSAIMARFAAAAFAQDQHGHTSRPGDSNILFADAFDHPTLAGKPRFTVLADVDDAFRWLHTPSIIEGRDGVLMAAWSSNGQHGDWDPTNVIELVRSSDQGITWSQPVPIVQPSVINPIFLRAGNGDVVLFYVANHSLRQDDGAIAFRRTPDNGITWSSEQPVDIGAKVSVIVNNGLTLPNGDWMISFHYDRSPQQGAFAVAHADYVACVAVSSDEGKTWRRYDAGTVPNASHSPNALSWAVEPAVVRTQNGMLRMIIRSRSGYLYETTSRDLGKTWAPLIQTDFSNDDSKPSILELSGGREVLMWNDTRLLDFNARYPLIATLSENDGETWFRSVTVEDSHLTLDYPTAIQVGDTIQMVFGYNRQQIRLVKLHLSDFKPWTPINNSGAWAIGDGVLRFAGDRGGDFADTTPDWLQWSKVVAFLPERLEPNTLSVDFRFDEAPSKDAVIGVFAAYQDEVNWTAWVWAAGKAGLQQQAHRGNPGRPFFAQSLSQDWCDPSGSPEPGTWYTLQIALAPGSVRCKLSETASGKMLQSSEQAVPWEGKFLALGSRKAVVSFKNLILRRGV